VGRLRRVSISNVVVYGADPRFAAIISGIPGHPVEDVSFSDIRVVHQGGLTMAQVAAQPDSLINRFFMDRQTAGQPRDPYAVPERENAYPEASMFGLLPAFGFYIRHAQGIRFDNVTLELVEPDERAAFVLEDVADIDFFRLDLPPAAGRPHFVLRSVRNLQVFQSRPMADVRRDFAEREEF
jgi:hypothetical protein